jgi:hypothetical protein
MLVLALASALLAAGSFAQEPPAAQPPPGDQQQPSYEKQFPEWSAVAARIDEHFKSVKEYRPGDMLSRGAVESLLAELAKLGWTVRDREAIMSQVTADKDLLVQQFSTPRGREFMRKVAQNPANFDHLHRLAQTSNGQRQVRDLMKLPNGPEVLAALASSPQGRDISRRIAAGPRTRNYDKPTGRIYTQQQLIVRLRESYAKELAERAKAKPDSTTAPDAPDVAEPLAPKKVSAGY